MTALTERGFWSRREEVSSPRYDSPPPSPRTRIMTRMSHRRGSKSAEMTHQPVYIPCTQCGTCRHLSSVVLGCTYKEGPERPIYPLCGHLPTRVVYSLLGTPPRTPLVGAILASQDPVSRCYPSLPGPSRTVKRGSGPSRTVKRGSGPSKDCYSRGWRTLKRLLFPGLEDPQDW